MVICVGINVAAGLVGFVSEPLCSFLSPYFVKVQNEISCTVHDL
jgi:hypothetical protein